MPLDRLANLDDLDSWSNLEGLDAYGSIDNLNMFLRFAEANPSIELTSSANKSTSTRGMSASVGAVGVSSATAVAIKFRAGFAGVNINASSLGYDTLKVLVASPAELSMIAASGEYVGLPSLTGNPYLEISASSKNTNVRQYLNVGYIRFTSDCKEMFTLDSNWTNSTDGSEVWVKQASQNEVWKIKQEGNERWGNK